MCLMSQNLNWLRRYDTKCTLRPRKILAKSEIDHQNLHLINDHFTTISGHFFAIYMKIFHKMEVQTVNLRCWTSLNHDWYNSYDTKCKYIKPKTAKNTNALFSTISQKNWNGNICILSHNFWFNQGLDLLNTSKWPSEPQFCEI